MSTLKVNTVESATTPTVLISDGLSVSGVSTLSGGLKVGTAVTISDNGNFGITGIMTASSYSGITTTSLPAGTVLQAVNAVHSTISANTTATYADTGLTASITISANGKVLILVTQPLEMKQNSTKMRGDVRLMRGSTEIYGNSSHQSYMMENQTTETKYLATYQNLTFLDTGASTGSNTYKTQIRCHTEGNSSRIRTSDNSAPASITLMEIAG